MGRLLGASLLLSRTAAAAWVWVHSETISAAIDSETGHLVHLNTSAGWQAQVDGYSRASDGSFQILSVVVTELNGDVSVTTTAAVQGHGTAPLQAFNATVTEVFSCADPSIGGLTWKLGVATSSSAPFKAAIATELKLLTVANRSFWLPENGANMDADVLQMRTTGGYKAMGLGRGYAASQKTETMPFPLFAWAGKSSEGGLIVAPSQGDTTIGALADLDASRLSYRRYGNKLSAARSWSWMTHIGALAAADAAAEEVAEEERGDDAWREALHFAVRVSPQVFFPVQPLAARGGGRSAVANVGMGLYSCAPAADVNKQVTVEDSGATTLWDASFSWPYMGMYLPPVQNSSTTWKSNVGSGEQMSCSKRPGGFRHGEVLSADNISDMLDAMDAIGVNVPLTYFNLFELGQNVREPLPPPTPGCDGLNAPSPEKCWKDSSTYIASAVHDSVLYKANGRLDYTWQNAIVMDPGADSYRKHLIHQAERHWRYLDKSFRGFAVDRTDHTTKVSRKRDDGLMWCGEPCASMLLAWMNTSAAISDVVHLRGGLPPAEPGKEAIILINLLTARADLLTYADGIFSEFGPDLLNSIGLSALMMPAIAWTYESPGPVTHAYLQSHLRMGVQPMAPVHGADHSIGDTDPRVVALYKDYGPLFRSLRATLWGFDRSHVVRVQPPPSKGGPKHNVFASQVGTPTKWLVVLALADANVTSVKLTLKLPVAGHANCLVMQPGQPARAVVVQQEAVSSLIELQAPLTHGCAVVECVKAADLVV